MKKLLSVVCVAMLLMVSGCSDASADISDGNTMIVQVGDKAVTKQDIYNVTKTVVGTNATQTKIISMILDKEVPVTDEITAKAQEKFEGTKALYGDAYEDTMKSYGYNDADDYYNKVSLLSVRQQELAKKYLIENDTLSTFTPIKAKILSFDSEESANTALANINDDGYSYDDVVDEYGESATYKGDELIYHAESGLPAALWQKITDTTETGVINEVVVADITNNSPDGSSSTTTTYYLVDIVNATLEDYKDEALEDISTKSSSIIDEAMISYLTTYEFRVWDIDIYNGIKKNKPKYLVQDN